MGLLHRQYQKQPRLTEQKWPINNVQAKPQVRHYSKRQTLDTVEHICQLSLKDRYIDIKYQ
jgi:hypothetical protein